MAKIPRRRAIGGVIGAPVKNWRRRRRDRKTGGAPARRRQRTPLVAITIFTLVGVKTTWHLDAAYFFLHPLYVLPSEK